uniref:G-protein coupled receptors family 2 profile 2 domain-containing protein n=1 Tax=Daphnia galeata TaxID=27404 RepID=A0A8J2WFY5_9CRUS|nr:unnamed protein product [Daphnia galeata]
MANHLFMVLIVCLCCWTCNGLTSHNDSDAVQVYQKTPLTKCCKDGEFYRPGLDRCLYRTHNPEEAISGIPVLYAVEEDETFLVGVEEFHLSHKLAACRIGRMATSTMEFQVFVDGSVKVPDALVLSPGQFCVNEIPSTDPINPEFVARYCVADPCMEDKTKCLRKCCPQGLAIDSATHSCRAHPAPFNVSQLTKKHGGPINVDAKDSLTVHAGFGFKCHNEDIVLVDNFLINSDGLMQPNRHFYHFDQFGDRPTDKYCIDNFIEGNVTKILGLRCFSSMTEIPESLMIAATVYPYLLFLSVLFLSATVMVYVLLPQLRDATGVIVMSYVSSMAIYYTGLGIIQIVPEMPKTICASLPVLVHFACLATFAWLNVLCFDLWWDIRISINSDENQQTRESPPSESGHSKSRRLVFYSIYGWGVPFTINIVGQVLETIQVLPENIVTPNFEQSQCWFLMTIMLLGNAIVVIMIVFALCKISRYSEESTNITLPNLTGVRVSMGLFLLMVALWMTDSISLLTEQSLITWVIADIVNIVTGLTIFVIFACKKQVWYLLKKKCPNCCRFLGRRRRASRRPMFPKSHTPEMPSMPSLCDSNGSRFIIYNSKIFRQSELAGEFSSASQGDLPSSYNPNSMDINQDLEEDIEIDVDLWNVDLDAIQVDTTARRPVDEREHVIV